MLNSAAGASETVKKGNEEKEEEEKDAPVEEAPVNEGNHEEAAVEEAPVEEPAPEPEAPVIQPIPRGLHRRRRGSRMLSQSRTDRRQSEQVNEKKEEALPATEEAPEDTIPPPQFSLDARSTSGRNS